MVKNIKIVSSSELDNELLRIPLIENKEDFVSIIDLANAQSIDIKIGNVQSPYLRKSVAEALLNVARYFKKQGFTIELSSAYRSLSWQQERFARRFEELSKQFPELDKDSLIELTNTYTAGKPILAAHTAGAAVDVILLDNNGNKLDYGVALGHGGEESHTNYSNIPKVAIDNRQFLKLGMEKHGFINYPFEFWHFSIGDVCAAYFSGHKNAVYGPVEYEDGQIKYVPNQEKLYEFFDI